MSKLIGVLFLILNAFGAQKGDSEMFQPLKNLNVPQFKIRAADDYFSDPLSIKLLKAAEEGDLNLARQLVKEGANPNSSGPADNKYNQISLLEYFIAKDNKKALQTLIQAGADVDRFSPSDSAGSALIFAANFNKIEMMKSIFEIKPLKDLDQHAITVLLFNSLTIGRPEVIDLLLKNGVHIDTMDSAGYTIFLRALDLMDFDEAYWLLEKGASVNIEAISGATPAFSLERLLNRITPENVMYKKAMRMKEILIQKGVKFPATSPQEIRKRRKK